MEKRNMAEYGLVNQFAALAQEYKDQYRTGRVLSQEKGIYRIVSEDGEQLAEVSGKLRYNAITSSDFPAVGDFVLTDKGNLSDTAIIHGILPRKSVFIRKSAGKNHSEQIVAANIDTVFICMSLNLDYNVRRLERYLSVAWDSGATPVIVFTKSDLCENIEKYRCEVERIALGIDILITSGLEKDGYKALLPYIQEGRTVALIGSSGVGKSTLINGLMGEDRLKTNGLRNDDKGKHTTTRRELFLLKQGGMVIDTPGMRELGLWDAEEGLSKSFADIESLAQKCRFGNCRHGKEPGCAIRQALASGELSEERWLSYQKLLTENRYAENNAEYMAEKKEKFKNISKINKTNRKK